MSINFEKIPSKVEVNVEVKKETTVEEELEYAKQLLDQRKTICKTIKPVAKRPKRPKPDYKYKFICVCPRYEPKYPCVHTGSIIIDRDVLTKQEHICYLATPKQNFAAARKQPRYYQKRYILPGCTARVEQLAAPDHKRVKYTLEMYKDVLKKKQIATLTKLANKPADIKYTSIKTALSYIEEERRLKRVQKTIEKRRCKRIKKNILKKQRKQIRKIVCVLFEEMKDFLLNDQFVIDGRSTLCTVILEHIRAFTEKEFYTTSNLREYQQILANNLTVWINKFISNLNIHVAPPQPGRMDEPDMDNFLPVKDYIHSCEEIEEDEYEIEEECSVEEEAEPEYEEEEELVLSENAIEPDE